LYSYAEFKLAIRPGLTDKFGSRITVDCTKPDGGELPATDAQWSTMSVARLVPADTAEQRKALGDMLGGCMFPPPVLAAFREELAGLPQDRGIRIRLRCDDDEMTRWPWELVRAQIPPRRGTRYLLRDERISLVRVLSSMRPVEPPKERLQLRILVADATEVRRNAVLSPDFPEDLRAADLVQPEVMKHPTRKSIDEFIDGVPGSPQPLDIFHFTGHGTQPRGHEAGALVLYRDQDRGEEFYPGNELAAQLDRAGTSLAFVNACHSDDRPAAGSGPGLAQSLAESVPVVLAMRGEVGDDRARDFAEAFYQSLLAGSTVDEAVARGRLELDEADADWQRAVLYSRASTGRFLEPATQAAEPVRQPPTRPSPSPQPAPDGIRRWAMVGSFQGHWQIVPGDTGPELRKADSETTAEIGHLRAISASLVLSSDARVVAELNRRRLALAWVDRVLPGLDPWPRSFELALDEEARLLAVAVDYGDEVVCLLSTDRATYQVDVSPDADPALSEIFGGPSRCAVMVAGSPLAADEVGRLRGWDLNLSGRGIAEVGSIDAARSGGRVVYAVAGHDEAGRPVVAQGRSMDTLTVLPDTLADEVVVVRPLSAMQPPDQILLSLGGRLDRVAVGEAL
jgi:CHAT domain